MVPSDLMRVTAFEIAVCCSVSLGVRIETPGQSKTTIT